MRAPIGMAFAGDAVRITAAIPLFMMRVHMGAPDTGT